MTETMKDLLIEGKLEGYSDNSSKNPNNYVLERELTVEITLNEYRELVAQAYKAKADKAESEANDRYWKINKLEKEVGELKTTLNKYMKAYGLLIDEDAEDGETL